MFDEKPAADIADQLRPALPSEEPESEEIDFDSIREADPADVADQRRIAPVLADDEPWP